MRDCITQNHASAGEGYTHVVHVCSMHAKGMSHVPWQSFICRVGVDDARSAIRPFLALLGSQQQVQRETSVLLLFALH